MTDLVFQATAAEHALCNAIRSIERVDVGRLAHDYKTIGDAALFAAAEKNGVAPIVAHSLLMHLFMENPLPAHWRNAFEHTAMRIQAYLEELDRMAAALAAAGIPLIALKNAGIARGIYRHSGASPMGDIDVLIRPEDFFAADNVLTEMGYRLKFRNEYEENNIEAAFKAGGAEYSCTLPGGAPLWVELQWRPIAGRWIQPEQEPNAADLVARARLINESDVLLMAPEDNLLQVCLHTAKHSFVRAPGFRLHTDVDRIVSGQSIDWGVFTQNVGDLRVRTATFFALAMAKSLLHTDIPVAVLTALKPPKWKIRLITRWLNHVGVFNPDDKKWSNLGYIFFVALLYDGMGDLGRAAFPPLEKMKQRYAGVNRLTLPWFHLRRLAGLVLHRTGI